MAPPPFGGMPVDIAPTATFLETALPTLLSSAALAIATFIPSPADEVYSPGVPGYAGSQDDITGGHHDGPHDGPPPNGECSLLGPFAILVQGSLGLLALSALIFKRWRERPQRPLKIWAFDVSKQVVGSILVHIANLLMSLLSSGQLSVSLTPEVIADAQKREVDAYGNYQPNPCSFYLLNLAIDTTIGIPILIVLLRIFTGLFTMTPFGSPSESIRSGNYGTPPRTWWWFKQSIIYFLGLLSMKVCVLIIFLVLPWISRVGDWALRWTEGNEDLQVFFVMLFFPLIMNATQYYIIDTFIKNQKPGENEEIPGHETEEDLIRDSAVRGNSFDENASGTSDEIGSGDEDEELKKPQAVTVKSKRGGRKDRHNYDEQFDGDSSLTLAGSGSGERHKLLDDDNDSESRR